MAGFDLTRVAGALKRVYDKKLHEVLYSADDAKLNPGFVGLKRDGGKKVTTPFGSAFVVPIKTGRVAASSADYTVAETISNSSAVGAGPTYDQFLVTPKKYYTVHRVDSDTLERATDEGAFIKASAEVVNDALKAHMRRLCIHSHGDGSGAVATITAAPTSTTVTVAPAKVRNFERGDMLVAAQFVASGGLRSATSLRVTGRNPVTGVLTLSGDPTALGWVSGDTLYFEGDRAAAGFDNVFKGFFAWAPITAPSGGESFYGVDRSVDTRLGGLRSDAAGKDIRKALIDAVSLARGEGSIPDRIRLSIDDMATLVNESDDLKTIELTAGDLNIGFKGVTVTIPGFGPINVLSDESMPAGQGLIERVEDWRLLAVDSQVASIVQHDGLILRKVNGADAFACYVKSQIAPTCNRPGHQVALLNIGA